MNGSRLIVDTNIIIYLLKHDDTLRDLLDGQILYLSFISEIELYGFKKMNAQERALIDSILSHVSVVHSNEAITNYAIDLKTKSSVKTPDAIIGGTAIFLGYPLLTSDKQLSSIKGLSTIHYERKN